MAYKRACILVFSTLLLSSCGKKRRNFFSYTETENQNKFNKLTLPVVKGVYLDANKISWLPITASNKVKLLGYSIYRFMPGKFIAKNPLNKKPLKQTYFTDYSSNKKEVCYIIRGIFEVNGIILEGPSSKIIYK